MKPIQWLVMGGILSALYCGAIDDELTKPKLRISGEGNVTEAKNIALEATVIASSSYCEQPGSLHCYDASKVIDGNDDSRVGGYYGWANDKVRLPQWILLSWPQTIKTQQIEIITSEGYPIQDYRLEYLSITGWRLLQNKVGNENLCILHRFPEIQTTQIRLTGLLGPIHQPQYVRVNEIKVLGEWLN